MDDGREIPPLPSDVWTEIAKLTDSPTLKALQSVSKSIQKAANETDLAKLDKNLQELDKVIEQLKGKEAKWKVKYRSGFSDADDRKVTGKLDAFDRQFAEIEANLKTLPKDNAQATRLRNLRSKFNGVKTDVKKWFEQD
jgi:septation ring formation regulator EzrA